MQVADGKSRVRDYWNKASPGYRAAFHDSLDEEIAIMKGYLRDFLPENPGNVRVLDIGTGLGIQAFTFAEMGCKVTALDFSEEMLRRAGAGAERRRLKISFSQGDAENLPFRNESFDIIINMHILWTLTGHERFFTECRRVLGRGGRILSIDGQWFKPDVPNPGNCPLEIRDCIPLCTANTPQKIAELMEAAGLSDISWRYLPEYEEYMRRCDRTYDSEYCATPYLVTSVKRS